jgi:UPF0176 protein
VILNVAAYRFVEIADPAALREQLQSRCESLGLRGSVLLAPEGINLFLAGTEGPLRRFLRELAADPRFADLPTRFSRSAAIPFGRLRVRLRKEIISFRQPGLDPARSRAPAVSPERLAHWLEQGHDDAGRELVLLDTRNREETAYGSFADALVLPIDNFTELPAALESRREDLRGKTVVGFCTGGIRCEKAVAWMAQAGYGNVVQLEGGILGWLERFGARGYRGDCFVFDRRVALDPGLRALSERTEVAHAA